MAARSDEAAPAKVQMIAVSQSQDPDFVETVVAAEANPLASWKAREHKYALMYHQHPRNAFSCSVP